MTENPRQRSSCSPSAPLVVLTGSSRGIGRATALELGHRGARLALFGRASSAQNETLHQLEVEGVEFRFYQADLEYPSQIADAARAVLLTEGVPDAVINNAACIERVSVEQMSLETWERQQAINLRAPFILVRELLPDMLVRRSGRFVQVASIAATLGTAKASAYCASKWGLVGFTKSLAEELSNTGLSSVAILPGSVDTDMLQGSGFVPRMSAHDVATTIAHYALEAPIAHNGAAIEMFGV